VSWVPRSDRLAGAAVLLAYAALAVLWAAPSSLSPADTIPDYGDPLHLSWVMAWDVHALLRAPWALFDSNSFHPYPRSLAFGDHLLPEAVLAAPVQLLTGNAVLASNAVLLAGLTLSAFAMFLLVRDATGSAEAGFVAGLVYTFNGYMLGEVLRVHVLHVQWWPVALLALQGLVASGQPRAAWALVGSLALQALSGTYYLVYTAMMAPVWLVGAYVLARRRPTSAELRHLAGAAVVATAAGLLLLWPYAVQLRTYGFQKSLGPSDDVLDYVLPHGSWLWGTWTGPRQWQESPHFLGFAALGLAGIAVVALAARRLEPSARRLAVLALVTGTGAAALSFGPVVHVAGTPIARGPYDLLQTYVPLARGMASPQRLGVMVLLGTAILAGIGLAAVLQRLSERWRLAAVAALALLVPLEHWRLPHTGVAVPAGSTVPEVYRWLASESREPLVELPLYPNVSRRYWAVYLYFSTYHWRPIPIGRTSFYPPAHDLLAWYLRGFPDDSSIVLLERLGIRTVVVHPRVWDPGEREERLARLEAEPRLRLVRSFPGAVSVAQARLELGDERVYRLGGERASAAAPCEPAGELPRDAWTFRATGRKRPDLVRDGDRGTAWFTAEPQAPGDSFEIGLPREEVVSAVALDMHYPYDEFPRNLVLMARPDAGAWRRIFYGDGPEERWATLRSLLERPREARLILRFPPERARRLRLRVGYRERDASWAAWAIPELRVYAECR
jgi:hypothetical protein